MKGKVLFIVTLLFVLLAGRAEAQRCLPKMRGIELRAGLNEADGYVLGAMLSSYAKGGNKWVYGLEYLKTSHGYRSTTIPAAQFTAEGGYYYNFLSDAKKVVFFYAGASALAGYETVNWGGKTLYDGARLNNKDAFVYGCAATLEMELYLVDFIALTASLRELEEELGLTIFRRTNRGAVLTPEGEEFLGYARQVLAQMDLMEEKYLGAAPVKHQFCVSTQHYSFAVEAFVELLREYGGPEYDFRIRETQTYELIEDVALLRSEVGVLYLNKDNETVLRKVIREHDLQFTPLFTAKPHVFVSASSPLAAKPAVTLDDLAPYPRLSYEQGEHNAFYFSEEILSTRDSKKDILVSDRATLFNLLIGLNGYTICSGVISESLNGPNIVAVPLLVDDAMQIGYLTHKQVQPGLFGKRYIEILQKHTAQ